jgi:hypothetical protein
MNMKSIPKFFALSLSLLILSISCFGQSTKDRPHSIINFIRGDKALKCKTDVTIQCQNKFTIKANSIIKYKVYSEGSVVVTMETKCSPGLMRDSGTEQITLNLKHGNEYYVLCTPNSFTEVMKSKVQEDIVKLKVENTFEEDLKTPIRKSSSPKQ